MSHVLPSAEIDRARDIFTDSRTYVPFNRVAGLFMSGCIDPRPEELGSQPHLVTKMGPGGEIGYASDLSVGLTITRKELVTPSQALAEGLGLERESIAGAHHSCAFSAIFKSIMGEQARPTDFTLWSAQRWIREQGLGGLLDGKVLQQAQDGAAWQEEHLHKAGSMDHLLPTIDEAVPQHDNVKHMRGESTPYFYIVNHLTALGLDRRLVHDQAQLLAQAYHDNLAARHSELLTTHSLPAETRKVAAASLLLRSAATRTLINQLKKDTGLRLEHWEITPGPGGSAVFEQLEGI